MGAVARARLPFLMLTFTNKLSISPEQVSKPGIGKYYIPVDQRLDHSACNKWVVGSSLDRGGAIFRSTTIRLFREQLFTVEMGAISRARLAFCLLILTNIISMHLFQLNYVSKMGPSGNSIIPGW